MNDVAIRVFDLGKQYRIGGARQPYKTFREAVTGAVSSPLRAFSKNGHGKEENTFWALKDVNFEIKRGEVVGVIGRNGAGKSTLLKILSRITEPTEGGADIFGRVGSLLEVGTGFHSELTGRENIYLSGAILGMKRAEIEKKFDEIVAFAEVEKFIDTPVKHYSSGMYLRLAFAVAAHLEPEILLVDEVLAVGDAAFQKKCLGKMGDVAREGRTVILVSHQMQAISHFCERSLLLDQGQLLAFEETATTVEMYLKSSDSARVSDLRTRQDRSGNGRFRYVDWWLEDGKGNRMEVVQTGQDCKFVLEYEKHSSEPLRDIIVAIGINTLTGVRVSELCNTYAGFYFQQAVLREGRITCLLPRLPLNRGTFAFNLMARETNGTILDYMIDAGRIEVESGDFYNTGRTVSDDTRLVLLDQTWTFDETEQRANGQQYTLGHVCQ